MKVSVVLIEPIPKELLKEVEHYRCFTRDSLSSGEIILYFDSYGEASNFFRSLEIELE